MPSESKDMPQRLLLTIPQAALILNISRAKLYEMIAKGKGPPVTRFGRSVRVSVHSLRKWVQEMEQEQNLV